MKRAIMIGGGIIIVAIVIAVRIVSVRDPFNTHIAECHATRTFNLCAQLMPPARLLVVHKHLATASATPRQRTYHVACTAFATAHSEHTPLFTVRAHLCLHLHTST